LRELPFGQPVVHVTEGTVHATAPLVLSAAAKGLANLKMSVIMATGTHREPAELGLEPLAPNIRVERWVSYDQLLPKTDVVVTTAGAGTVLATLQAEIPMVVIPTEWDKPEVARRVAVAGAGVLLEPEHCTPERLRAAVERVLGDPAFRQNARRLAASFKRYGGPVQAAELLEKMATEALVSSPGAARPVTP
jgi:MGT family glycosyltransferase